MKNGDFIEIDFIGKIALTGEVFDVTNAEEARKIGEFNEKAKYEPALVVMGQKMVVRGVERQLEDMNVGDEREFDVGYDEGFGRRFPELMRVIPKKDFIKQNINPVPGVFITIDGKQAKIQSVSGGRIRVDFNHPLAGRDLIYKVKIVRKLSEPAEMSQKFLSHFGISTECKFSDGKLVIKAHERLKNLVEKMFAEKIKAFIPEVKEVDYMIEEAAPAENRNAAANIPAKTKN